MSNDLKPRTTVVYLFQGDDYDRVNELQAAVQTAQLMDSTLRRVGDGESVSDALAAYNEYVAEAEKRAVKVELTALGRRKWRDLVLAHPPRIEDGEIGENGQPERVPNEQDAGWGFNYETLADDLLPVSVDSKQFSVEWLDNLSDGDWSKLYSAAVRMNQGTFSPKVLEPSPGVRTSSETSTSPSRLG